MSPETGSHPELTPEQWAAGRQIAQLCDIDDEVLERYMVWNGRIETVGYGFAHSGPHMAHLTVEEIRQAVYGGIAAYEAQAGMDH